MKKDKQGWVWDDRTLFPPRSKTIQHNCQVGVKTNGKHGETLLFIPEGGFWTIQSQQEHHDCHP